MVERRIYSSRAGNRPDVIPWHNIFLLLFFSLITPKNQCRGVLGESNVFTEPGPCSPVRTYRACSAVIKN
jgi:hypothetical protein